jgi:hypothetical protein
MNIEQGCSEKASGRTEKNVHRDPTVGRKDANKSTLYNKVIMLHV